MADYTHTHTEETRAHQHNPGSENLVATLASTHLPLELGRRIWGGGGGALKKPGFRPPELAASLAGTRVEGLSLQADSSQPEGGEIRPKASSSHDFTLPLVPFHFILFAGFPSLHGAVKRKHMDATRRSTNVTTAGNGN